MSGKDDRGEPVSRLYVRRSMIELENGDLLACADGRFESDKAPVEYLGVMSKVRSFLLRSSDRGASWKYVSTIAADPVEQEGAAEPVLVRLTRSAEGPTDLPAAHRPRESYLPMRIGRRGRAWTRAYPLSWQYSGYGRRREIAGTDPDVIEMADGTLAMSFGHNPDYEDHGNFLAFSVDQGRSWTHDGAIDVAFVSLNEALLYCITKPRPANDGWGFASAA